jgi:hypothetical protein
VSQLSLLSHASVIRRLLSANENSAILKDESVLFGLQVAILIKSVSVEM